MMPSTPVSQFSTTTPLTPAFSGLNNNNSKESSQQQSHQSETTPSPTVPQTNVEIVSNNVKQNVTLSLADILNTDEVFEPILINYVIRQMINDPDPG